MPAPIVVHVLPHTHWDREWYEPFDVYRHRLVGVVDDLAGMLRVEPSFHFHFDGQTAAIEDYLEVRPDRERGIAEHVAAGRLAVGPWRILMDEFLCSGETIVRNLRQGMAMARRLGADPKIGYIPDSFGHVAQMPQILALAGMSEALVWRGVPFAVDRTAFWWEAPDGTRLRTMYLATTYSNGATLPETFEELMVRTKRLVDDLAPFNPHGIVLAMNGSDHLGPQAHLPSLLAEANRRQDEFEFRVAPLSAYVAEAPREDLPTWRGEMRSSARANLLMGVLSARITLKQLEFRASTLLERYAEPLSVLAGTDPGLMLERAWRGMVENSAHDSVCGCGVDAVAEQVAARYVRAARVADVVASDALTRIASRIDSAAMPGDGAVVFNPSPRQRQEVFETTLMLAGSSFVSPGGEALAVQPLEQTEQVIVDMTLTGAALARMVPTIHSRKMGTLYVNGLKLEAGRTSTVRLKMGPLPIGDFDIEASKAEVERAALARPRARFHVLGMGPPLVRALVQSPPVGGLGWSLLTPAGENPQPKDRPVATDRSVTNGTLRAEVQDDGSIALTHVPSGTRFDGIGLRDGGEAGDEYTYSPPERDTIVEAPASFTTDVVSNGPLEARLRVHALWRIPASIAPNRKRRAPRRVVMQVVIDLALRSGEEFLRLDIRVDNTAEDHRLRLTVPLPFDVANTNADSAFAVVERGLEAEGAPHERGTPTFPSRSFVDASAKDAGVAVLHHGTPEYECTGQQIAVTLLRCVGWLSRQDLRYRTGPAGPMVPAPGAQMKGSHDFSLAIYPHTGGWQDGGVLRAAESFALPLRATQAHPSEGTLPQESAPLEIEPESVRLSGIERRERSVEMRIFNASAAPVVARISQGEPLGSGTPVERPMKPWEISTVRLG